MLKLYQFECPECGTIFEDLVESATEHPTCPACDSPSNMQWVAPSIRTSDSKTYLDGTRPGWKEIKEWARLDEAMEKMKPEDKSRAEKEATKILGV